MSILGRCARLTAAMPAGRRLLSSTVDGFQPCVPIEEFQQRQQRLVELVHESNAQNKLKLLLVPAAERAQQADTIIPSIHYKQNGDFVYLTGLNTADAAGCVFAILADDGQIAGSYLFAPPLLPRVAVWEGRGVRSAYHRRLVQPLARQIDEFASLRTLLENRELQVFAARYWSAREEQMHRCIGRRSTTPLSPYLDRLRAVKSQAEMQAMRRTCRLGVAAMNRTVDWSDRRIAEGDARVMESQLSAMFDSHCRLHGAGKPAYPTVVAGGERATTIHYGVNCNPIAADEWVLMDAGCEDLEGYNSDITRSWPIGGRRDTGSLAYALHQALVETQRSLIDGIVVGQTSLNILLEQMCRRLGTLLKEFGVIRKELDAIATREAVFHYCPHHVSHYLGRCHHSLITG